MCGSRKKFIRGGGGVLTAKFLEEMYENKLEFPGGRVDANQKTFLGGIVDIFWKCTIKQKKSHLGSGTYI